MTLKAPYPLVFCFLLFACSAKLGSVAADAAPSPVLDITGNKLQTGVDYYILPVIRGRGGGLTLASTSNKTSCPLDVVQEQNEVSNGLSLKFAPVNVTKGVVRVSTDLNIKFSATTICVQSTVWKLGKFDEQTGQWFVTSGGVEGNPGRQTTSNWFKIEKFAVMTTSSFSAQQCAISAKLYVGVLLSVMCPSEPCSRNKFPPNFNGDEHKIGFIRCFRNHICPNC